MKVGPATTSINWHQAPIIYHCLVKENVVSYFYCVRGRSEMVKQTLTEVIITAHFGVICHVKGKQPLFRAEIRAREVVDHVMAIAGIFHRSNNLNYRTTDDSLRPHSHLTRHIT